MFSQTVEYALRAMVQLAIEAPEACTTQDIAEATDVPGAYLAKVLQSLRRAGLITSRRGVGGGVKLAKPAKKVSLLNVMNAVEPLERAVDGARSRGGGPQAALNRTIDAILGDMKKSCAAVSLEDLTRRPASTAKKKPAKKKRSR